MTQLNFYIVDVFALEKYTGNQLAVFTGSGAISKHEMQQIANVTDTIFLNTCDTQRS
ncbi:MAG: phenazine biosynthesis protein, partial [Cyanobacteria bacterium QH_3_48_40]